MGSPLSCDRVRAVKSRQICARRQNLAHGWECIGWCSNSGLLQMSRRYQPALARTAACAEHASCKKAEQRARAKTVTGRTSAKALVSLCPKSPPKSPNFRQKSPNSPQKRPTCG